MAITCPTDFDVTTLREQVLATYERVSREPGGDFHFHRGIDYACTLLAYERQALERLPRCATEAFAGVGNPHRIAPIQPGEVVLDHACGAGMDLMLSAQAVGPTGKAIGVDLTAGMLERARRAAREAGLQGRVTLFEGTYEALPVADESVDVVLSNGVVNLAPDKGQVFREIARVLRPGGRLLLADVVVQRELTLQARKNPELWAACIAGALTEPELVELSESVGLEAHGVLERFDCFRDTSAERRLSRDLRVQAVGFLAVKRLER